MNREEFMRRLTALLQDVPPAEREEALTYYNEYFDDAGEENEADVIAALGSPEELAKSIKAGLADGGNGGEFTESGFHGYEQRNKNQLMSTNGRQENAQGTGGAYQGGTQETRRTARRAHMALIVSSQTAQAAHTAINSRQEAVREMRRAHRRRNL